MTDEIKMHEREGLSQKKKKSKIKWMSENE